MATQVIGGRAAEMQTNAAWRRLHGLQEAVRAFVQSADAPTGTRAALLTARLEDEASNLRAELTNPQDEAGATASGLARCLVEITELRHDLREHATARRLEHLDRIRQALARLRELKTSAALIEAAPRALCECGDFDRALISRIQGSTWLPQRLHVVRGGGPVDAQLARWLDGRSIPLTTTLLETEQIRRKMPALVRDPRHDPRTFQPLIEAARTRAYVSAPLMPTGRVIGLLHADTATSGRELTTADRDHIFMFAEGFGIIFERAVLLEQLQSQGARVKETFALTGRLLDELCASEVNLARREIEPAAAAETATRVLSTARGTRITAVLTQRERDVFALMAEGATNSQIAGSLVIAEGTVKSHVKHILRKMRVSNRAEAVSRYLRVPEDSR